MIAETYFQLLNWINLTCFFRLKDVMILIIEIWPIRNPVSSKL